jgi:non-heme chloroperoxidase
MTAKTLEKTLILPGGLEISYAEQGDRSGPALLILHGYTDSFRGSSRLMAQLPDWIRTIALTLRGHGDSTKAISTYRTGEHAADIAQVMDALAIDSAVIAGHSMGSMVAQRFAVDFGARVQGLALLGAFRTLRGNPAVEELWRDGISKLEGPVDRDFVRAFQESTLHKPVPSAFLSMVIDESMKVPAFVWRSALHAIMQEDLTPELAKITARTMLIWGDHDAFIPHADQLELALLLPRAELHVMRGIGHAPHWEDPEAVASMLARLVQSAQSVAA